MHYKGPVFQTMKTHLARELLEHQKAKQKISVFRVTLLYLIFLVKPSILFLFSQKKGVTGIKYVCYI